MDFKSGRVVVVGDFNFPLDPQLDVSSHAGRKGRNKYKLIKKMLSQLQLLDVWRIQHPQLRDYTFYSSVHGTYSRLDYILVEHRILE